MGFHVPLTTLRPSGLAQRPAHRSIVMCSSSGCKLTLQRALSDSCPFCCFIAELRQGRGSCTIDEPPASVCPHLPPSDPSPSRRQIRWWAATHGFPHGNLPSLRDVCEGLKIATLRKTQHKWRPCSPRPSVGAGETRFVPERHTQSEHGAGSADTAQRIPRPRNDRREDGQPVGGLGGRWGRARRKEWDPSCSHESRWKNRPSAPPASDQNSARLAPPPASLPTGSRG